MRTVYPVIWIFIAVLGLAGVSHAQHRLFPRNPPGDIPASHTLTMDVPELFSVGEGALSPPTLYQTSEKSTPREHPVHGIVKWTALCASAVAAGLAVKYNGDAGDAYSMADDAYAEYESALTNDDAVYWRAQAEHFHGEGRDAAKKRNVMYAASGALLGLGVAFAIW